MSKESAKCPYPECEANIPVPRHLVDSGPRLCECRCGAAIEVVPLRDEGGNVVLRRVLPLAGKTLRKGDEVLLRHTYQGVHGGCGEWYSISTVGRGGKSPRDEQGAPLDMQRIAGRLEEAVS